MSIDINTLRIGAHISIGGKRERVRGLDEDNGLIVRFPAEYVSASEAEPISLTPGLLTELGFEERRREHRYGSPDVWYIDPEAAQSEKEHSLVVPKTTFIPLTKIGRPDLWAIKAVVCDKPMRTGEFACRYLHEAEAFLALHGVELIPD